MVKILPGMSNTVPIIIFNNIPYPRVGIHFTFNVHSRILDQFHCLGIFLGNSRVIGMVDSHENRVGRVVKLSIAVIVI